MLRFERLDRFRVPAWAQDSALALVVTVLQVQGTVAKVDVEPATVIRPLSDLGGLGIALLAVSGLVLVVRRRWPVAVFLTTAAASVAYYSLDFPDGPGWIALFVATLHADRARRRAPLARPGRGRGLAVLAIVLARRRADIEPRAAIGWVFFRIGATGDERRPRRERPVAAGHRGRSARARRAGGTDP